MAQNFQDLKVWQEAVIFHKNIIPIISKFPKEETYAMSSQLRRASLSVSNNIAEGCGRKTRKELRSFLSISMGSLKEVESMLLVAKELNYITEEISKNLLKSIDTLGKRLNVLIQKVDQNIK